MYFLADFTQPSLPPKKEEEKKVGLLKKGLQLAIGKTPTGTLTRAAGLAGIGGSLYGIGKMRTTPFQTQAEQLRRKFMRKKFAENVKNAVTSDMAKGIGASAVGTVAGGLALNEGRKLYEKKTRKWWEIL